MYLWRKAAEPRWLKPREELLRARFGSNLAVISALDRQRLQIEIACRSRNESDRLVRQFGGRTEKLSRDWLERFRREQKTEPLRIGKRLVVVRSRRKREAVSFPYSLIIPAGVAFGTGDHATTAMSLRLLEKLTRNWKPGWSIVDLGTGSGILALAARRFGARSVTGIDNDPLAISTAKQNARLNRIGNVDFRAGDVRRWKSPRKVDIVSANLFSELLIEILPRLKRCRWLMLSGVMRVQEKGFIRALRRNKIDIVEGRRRGKWLAVLAKII